MPAKLSYINARGDEIVLDDDERSFLAELQGRQGFEAPEVDFSTVKYADGTEEVLRAELKPREVTCFFWAETLDHQRFEQKFSELKMQMIQVGKKPENWGRLRIRKRSGGYLYLNCIYSEGLDSLVRDSDVRVGFSLTFLASDPLFYDDYESHEELRVWEDGAWLHFGTRFTFGLETHFRSSNTIHEQIIEVPCYRAYPAITIVGPAKNIKLENETTGGLIELDQTFELLAGETFVIETDPLKRSAVWNRYDGSQKNGSRYLSPDTHLDWTLGHGKNKIRYRNSDTNQTSVCILTYKQGWLSAY